jgi:hypothetical protein
VLFHNITQQAFVQGLKELRNPFSSASVLTSESATNQLLMYSATESSYSATGSVLHVAILIRRLNVCI